MSDTTPSNLRGGARVERKLLAVLTAASATAITSAQDVLIKWISGEYPFHQMQTIRCAVATLLALGYLAATDGLGALLQVPLRAIFARGLLLAVASVLFYLTAVAMPFAEAVALYFTMPIVVAILAGAVLGERVGWHRLLAIAIGFAGVVAILRPGAAVFEPAALLGLACAVLYAMGNMMTRSLRGEMPTGVVVVVMSACYCGVAALLALVFGWGGLRVAGHPSLDYLTRGWTMPTGWDLLLIGSLGLTTGLLMLLFTAAYRLADASFVAPFEYTGMIWAVTFSYLLWHEVPDGFGLTGMVLIAAAGLFMLAVDGYRRRQMVERGKSVRERP